MQQRSSRASLWNALSGSGNLSDRFLCGADASVALGDLVRGSALGGRGEELRDRSVLVATTDQLTAALALIELDGIARRLVLCPPDVPQEHLPFVIGRRQWMRSFPIGARWDRTFPTVGCLRHLQSTDRARPLGSAHIAQTEWILLTSGTTGAPKLVGAHLGESGGSD